MFWSLSVTNELQPKEASSHSEYYRISRRAVSHGWVLTCILKMRQPSVLTDNSLPQCPGANVELSLIIKPWRVFNVVHLEGSEVSCIITNMQKLLHSSLNFLGNLLAILIYRCWNPHIFLRQWRFSLKYLLFLNKVSTPSPFFIWPSKTMDCSKYFLLTINLFWYEFSFSTAFYA